MRTLLLDPEDSPRRGPWSRQRWDLVVDLGRSSPFSAEAWARQYGCRVIRADSFRQGMADARLVRDAFSAGTGNLIDEEGIDWWNLTSLLFATEALETLALGRIAAEIGSDAELWATRSGGAARLLAILLDREVRTFGGGSALSTSRILHYASVWRRFSAAQIKEIVLDKYDPAYRWRARFSAQRPKCSEQVVLIPSAYANVSRMAAAYARLLPQQEFLMVVTRQNAKQFVPPPNVQVRDLAAYAKGDPPARETFSLLDRWTKLSVELRALPELRVLSQAGVFDPIADWIRHGISTRNAWREVLDREPVCGVLCGDDSNRYTCLPVLLAARRKTPTVDFHHGALDGRHVLKDLPCDVYLAKNEMERDYLVSECGLPAEKIAIGAPAPQFIRSQQQRSSKTSAIFFSEPYEVLGMRPDEVYGEILPALCRLARENGHDVIVKLHPFESRTQRGAMVRDLLAPEDARLVTVVDGPLTEELMSRAWFGITVESTTVLDCLQNGVACFLCGWLTLSQFEYAQQYARFGVGEVLQTAEQIAEIPRRLVEFRHRPANPAALWATADPAVLRRWLTSDRNEPVGARSAS